MKFLVISLAIFFLILLLGSWFIANRPELLAVGDFEGKLKFLKKVSLSEELQIVAAYDSIKDRLPETFRRRAEARKGKFSDIKTAKFYIVKDKQWLYFFADGYPFKSPKMEVLAGRDMNSIRYHLRNKSYDLRS